MQQHDDLQTALALLFDNVPTGSKVSLFGSRARGGARVKSDHDFLVIEPRVRDCFAEMVRLSSLLGSALIPADILVLSESTFQRWRREPNSLANHAWREGRIYESVA
ncbi:MAG: nucleotidyltransferase domain-containing protein [Phycisphaerae bacterium]|nr:nucleotidyltransferase domain-containing protein [Phycisphaerae bacterium]